MSDESIVRPVNLEILGMQGTDNLIEQTIPAINIINTTTFRIGEKTNQISFHFAPQTTGRLGIFAAKKNNVERAVIILLPKSGIPDGVLICVTQQFQQAKALNAFNWENPLSPQFVHYALLKHVINRWGAQLLASQRNLVLVYILRAKGANELGPFKDDGKFFADVLKQISAQTNNSFSPNKAEAFTFSSGIYDFNSLIAKVSKHIPINAVYNIDPDHSMGIANPSGGRVRQYASGAVGGFLPGFEPMPLERWVNESTYRNLPESLRLKPNPRDGNIRQYLHNHTMPNYCLYLALKGI